MRRTSILLGDAAATAAAFAALRWAGGTQLPPDDPTAYLCRAVLLAAYACVAWLAGSVVLGVAATAPGLLGRLSSAAAAAVTPAVLRRAVATAVGVALVGAPAGAAVAHPSGPVPHISVPVLDRVPTLPAPVATPSPPRPARTAVVVRAGDSLWRIAARRLGPAATPGRVARDWPRWYAANRTVIGPDPDLLRIGERLEPPR